MTIIEQITKRGAAGGYHHRQATVRCGGNHLESLAVYVTKQERTLRLYRPPVLLIDITEYMPICHKEIKVSVVTKIEEAGRPTQKRKGWAEYAGLPTDIEELSLPFVTEKGIVVVGENCYSRSTRPSRL